MIATLFGIESLAVCVLIGFILIGVWCAYFTLMLIYAIVAECNDYPMPLDENYLIGKINIKLFLGIGILALVLVVI